MKIYRIENEDGIGPFAKAYFETTEHKDFYVGYFWKMLNDIYVAEHKPNLEQDGLTTENGLTGCKTKKDIIFWFPQDLMVALDGMGFTLNEYEVDSSSVKIGKSGKQLSFDENTAVFVNETSLEDLYKIHPQTIKKVKNLKIS